LAWVELFAVPPPRQHVVTLQTLRNLNLISDIELRERPIALWGTLHRWLETERREGSWSKGL
jgi:hypothetical protein